MAVKKKRRKRWNGFKWKFKEVHKPWIDTYKYVLAKVKARKK